MSDPYTRTQRERDEFVLVAAQKRVTQGELADLQRKEALWRLHYDGGVTQPELAQLLTRASVAAGGAPYTTNAVFKLLRRLRRANGRDERVAS